MFSFGLNDVPAPTKNTTVPPPSHSVMDEEAQKRNTDCIYFLASPLTCKKGSNCEYRHNEAARMNPRDCRFWKAGNCLNPRCSFRHLPLDGKPALAASIPSTSSAPSIPQPVPTTLSSNKSQTPCIFFSRGCCAKNDKCPFMHNLSAASRADAVIEKNPAVEVNGKFVHNGGRSLIMLKKNAHTDGRPTAVNGSQTPKGHAISLETPQIPSGLGKSKASQIDRTSVPARQYNESRKPVAQFGKSHDGAKQGQPGEEKAQGLQNRKEKQRMFVQAAGFIHHGNHHKLDVPLEDRRLLVNGLERSAVQSNSNQITNSLSGSSASNERDSFEQSRSDDSESFSEDNRLPEADHVSGQLQDSLKHAEFRISYQSGRAVKRNGQSMHVEKKDPFSDLHNHLVKRQKNNSFHAVLQNPGIRQQTDLIIDRHGNQRQNEDQDTQQVGNSKADKNELKEIKSIGREGSSHVQRVWLNKTEKSLIRDNRLHRSCGGTSKGETRTFAGPKSLAQIKAEKLAAASNAVHKDNLSTITDAAGEKAVAGKLARHAEVLNGKPSSSPVSLGSTIKRSVYTKQKSDSSVDFESPKPLSLLLKRKRELNLDGNAMETVPGLPEVEMSALMHSCEQLEDGEVGDESHESEEGGSSSISCHLVSIKEDLDMPSPSSRQVLQSAGVAGAQSDMDLLEDALKSDAELEVDALNSDAELEEMAYGDAGYGTDDDDDDDDFAKKLGRFFTLSSD